MKKDVHLYNVLFPIWMLWLFPQVWLIVLPGNLLVDCLVLTLALLALKHRDKWPVVKQLWWKSWLLGFLADFIGVALLMPSLFLPMLWESFTGTGPDWIRTHISPLGHNAFLSPVSFLWMLTAVALSGVCIYFFDKKAMKSCSLLTPHEKHIVALAMAIVTAPWLFFIPIY